MRKQQPVILIILLSVIFGCSRHEHVGNIWNPKTKYLDQLSLDNTNFVNLARDVKDFYNYLEKKDWESAYERRWKTYRQDFPKNIYIKTANSEGRYWGLINYEILSVETHNSDEAVLICKFVELPDSATAYATVRWRNEDGTWKCDAAGPEKLSIFRYTRMN